MSPIVECSGLTQNSMTSAAFRPPSEKCEDSDMEGDALYELDPLGVEARRAPDNQQSC